MKNIFVIFRKRLFQRNHLSGLTPNLLTYDLGSGDLGRPIVAPPGLPPERTRLLREAFMKSMSDPALLAEANKKKIEITPTSGNELEALAKEVVDQPHDVIERMKKILGK